MADKWIQKATNPRTEGALRRHFGVKKGEDIPLEKINEEIGTLRAKAKNGKLSPQESMLLKRLIFAKNMKTMNN